MVSTPIKALKALAIGVVSICLFALPASARDTDGEAFIQSLANDATALLSDGSMNDQSRIAEFQNLFIEKTAIRQFGRSALGAYSRVASDEEFDQYVELLAQYATAIVANNLGEYSGQQIVVTNSTTDARESFSYVSIESDVVANNGDRLAGVRWLLIQRGDQYRIYDITVETLGEEGTFSLLQTQREEFASIISNNGNRIRPLLRYLRDRISDSGMTPANMASN